MSIMDAVVGGSLSNGTIFALGISPYISASIIIQLLTVAFPALERLSKEGGEEGRKKIAQYTRIFAIVLAVVQGIGILLSYRNLIDTALVDNNPSWTWVLYVAIVLTCCGTRRAWPQVNHKGGHISRISLVSYLADLRYAFAIDGRSQQRSTTSSDTTTAPSSRWIHDKDAHTPDRQEDLWRSSTYIPIG